MKKILLLLLILISSIIFLILSFYPRLYLVGIISVVVLAAFYMFAFKPGPKRYLYSVVLIVILISFFHVGIYLDMKTYNYCFDNQEPLENTRWIKPRIFKIKEVDSLINNKIQEFNEKVISQVYYLEDTFNIRLLTYHKNNNTNSMLILAGIHGDEYAGVFSIPEIMDNIIKKGYSDWNFDIIYTVNPVGLVKFSHLNETGCDVNRDFNNFSTLQSKMIKSLVDTSNYNLVLDLHEGPYSGSIVFINRYVNRALVNTIYENLEKEKIRISEYSNKPETHLKYYTMNSFLAKKTNIRPLSSYLTEKKIISIASESDVFEDDFNSRIRSHVVVFESIMNHLVND